MEHPQLPNPDQQRLRWIHQYAHPRVVPIPKPVVENTGHDDFIDSTERQIEFHEQELYEGERRSPPMPEVQLEVHREQLEIHHKVLKGLLDNVVELVQKEPPEDLVA